jgi:hypothetical protein
VWWQNQLGICCVSSVLLKVSNILVRINPWNSSVLFWGNFYFIVPFRAFSKQLDS